MILHLKHCLVEITDYGCITKFFDGTETAAWPHDSDDYRTIADRLGYGSDTLAYCREHEILHSLTQEWLHDRPSPVLWGVAHNKMLTARQSIEEEVFTQTMQRFIRADERPIVSCSTLDRWKAEALRLLNRVNNYETVA